MTNGIRIDELDATVLPSRDHVVPAMKDGLTVKLTVGQILDLLGKVLDPDGVGSKALFAALNLSDLDDPEQARSNIGVVLQSSATDATAGRVLTVGAFGIGAQRVETKTDLDNYNVPGFYITPASGLTNLPAGWSQAQHILIVSGGTSYTLQIIAKAGGGNTGQAAYRVWSGTAWGDWQALFNPGNILGTVSQSGGVPTGAIIERGSNANGEYVRYADGTQICTKKIVTNVTVNITWGSIFQSDRISGGNFAASFIEAPTISFNSHDSSNNSFPMVETGLTGSVVPDFFLVRGASAGQLERTVSIIAVGRWF